MIAERMRPMDPLEGSYEHVSEWPQEPVRRTFLPEVQLHSPHCAFRNPSDPSKHTTVTALNHIEEVEADMPWPEQLKCREVVVSNADACGRLEVNFAFPAPKKEAE